ncbi:Thioredoxin [Auxenochlorella protothecoides]|uniref:Thioredoxin n=2 Tax=Auxenochlorella protothecoides TaxID=3075 RepID=A0A087SER4_AUXPR|nr:Thioredoxin [Auxenochlorella protothecoides]KFM24218.1 Thioredoxin [Auxenochlorella protothecoides]
MLEKAGDRLVIVQYYQSTVLVCKQMRLYFTRLSGQPNFQKVIFAEVDVEELQKLALEAGLDRIPTYICYIRGEPVDKYVGGTPALVQSLVDQCLSKYCNTSRSGKAELAVKVAVAVGAVTAGEPGLNSLRNVFWSGGRGLRIVLVHVCLGLLYLLRAVLFVDVDTQLASLNASISRARERYSELSRTRRRRAARQQMEFPRPCTVHVDSVGISAINAVALALMDAESVKAISCICR